jgi:hypothetical protein
LLALEGMAIGPDPKKGDHRGAVAADLGGKTASSPDEFLRCELVSGGRAAVDEVRDPVAVLKQLGLFPGSQLLSRKTGAVQRGPEAVAGAGEMVAGGGGIEARIDADEQDLQAGGDNVPDAFVCRGLEISLARPA